MRTRARVHAEATERTDFIKSTGRTLFELREVVQNRMPRCHRLHPDMFAWGGRRRIIESAKWQNGDPPTFVDIGHT